MPESDPFVIQNIPTTGRKKITCLALLLVNSFLIYQIKSIQTHGKVNNILVSHCPSLVLRAVKDIFKTANFETAILSNFLVNQDKEHMSDSSFIRSLE